jgi:hypothetical protein
MRLVAADREQLHAARVELRLVSSQLTELVLAPRSPIAAIEHEHDRTARELVDERDGVARLIRQRECTRLRAVGDARLVRDVQSGHAGGSGEREQRVTHVLAYHSRDVVRLIDRFRVLVPSWRFFDRAIASPQLFVAEVGGTWQPLAAPPRRWFNWAFAPAANLVLAYRAAVDHLVAEISALDPETPDDDPAITGSVSYELVTRIARTHVAPGTRFRWKIATPDDPDFVQSAELACPG